MSKRDFVFRTGRNSKTSCAKLVAKFGNPIASWQDGKVVIIPPEEILIEDDDTTK